MPELPEVETVRSGLEKYVINRRITSANSYHFRAIKPNSIAPLAAVVGARIRAVKRRGKFLWFELDREFTLVAHLGMSGQLLISPKKSPNQSHLRARIELQKSAGLVRNKSAGNEIRFIDQRTFGWLSIEQMHNQIPTSVAHIAYDPFEAEFNLKNVIADISSRKSAIKPAILNQEIISGIGNIYADEALWRAKIHPEIICEDLSEDEIKKLINSAKAVMKSAIKAGGTSFDQQYKNVNGASGYFSRSLSVYGRAGQPCSRCATLIRRIAFANRSSHFCPRCQR
jgi:formamidopyrimidine-DNA glycosylase